MQLTSRSLDQIPIRENIGKIIAASLAAVDPYLAVKNALRLDGSHLFCSNQGYDLEKIHQIRVIGAGKAGFPMTEAVVEILARWQLQGCVIVKEGHAPASQVGQAVPILEAGHPIPDERGVGATRELVRQLAGLRPDDLVICLISGGGSALLTSPAPGLTLDDLQQTTRLLLRSGADISALNRVRKHLDTIKGGGLAKLMLPAQGITLILSDVLGDPLESIASGPTVPDPSTFLEALAVLADFDLLDQVPARVLTHLQSGAQGKIAETAKPGDACFDRLTSKIIGSNYLAAQAACEMAKEAGFNVLLLSTNLEGEAQAAGRYFGEVLKQIAILGKPLARPAFVIAGGETTVTVRGDGMGGRNLEFALGAIDALDRLDHLCLITLATDGGDGPTDAAGAVVTGSSLEHALALNLLPQAFLDRNDSYHFFERMGDLIKTGPTLTNVNDLNFGFVW